MPQIFKAGFPASLFAFVLATVMVGSGLLFDRMAAVGPQTPLRVALLDRVPPSRVEPVAVRGETGELAAGQSALANASPAPMRLALRPAHENAPVRAQARRGDKKKPVPAVFGPQPALEDIEGESSGFRP